ncbi:MarR family winged helix-turn-helix transcriptional regulator [Pararhodobacter sp. CCB-MM2]|uniref:MarR family winged helix-turn-helix transcriptional regulator n=1 Tax=Pararhodobacter sp. CCB-MM2 TaxID=1786003 RepID=UPI0008353DEE|nr:MarR family winged helix-turn-helix transcriptional regulator [Pararhodobacter sp. CCB-MM2]
MQDRRTEWPSNYPIDRIDNSDFASDGFCAANAISSEICNLAVQWSRSAFQTYQQNFAVGSQDWRVLSALGVEPEINAKRICEILQLDKGAVSRSISRLHEAGYLSYEESASRDRRRRIWSLSDEGLRLHASMHMVALQREQQLVDGLSHADLKIFRKVVKTMSTNLHQ